MKLDALDRKILRVVQENCTINADELAERCASSPSTILRRLKKLRESGVIKEEVAILDPKKAGRPLQMIVGVRLERDNASVAAAFIRQMREHPGVMQCYFVTGAADYIIIFSARDMDDYDAFTQMLVENPHVAISETNVVINPLKVGLKIPIDE